MKPAKNRGVDFSSGDSVTKVNVTNGCASGVTTTKTSFVAAKVVNCAGAWAGQIAPAGVPDTAGEGSDAVSRYAFADIDRACDSLAGSLSDSAQRRAHLVGATVEEEGFDKRTDRHDPASASRRDGTRFQSLRNAKILEDWAGLRPGTPDALPILGATATPGYYVATGHFRDGILLAPITAQVMANVIEGGNPDHDLSAFSPARFTASLRQEG